MQQIDFRAVVIGGMAVEFWTRGAYSTADIDLYLPHGPAVLQLLGPLGFERRRRHYVLEDVLEAPGPSFPGETEEVYEVTLRSVLSFPFSVRPTCSSIASSVCRRRARGRRGTGGCPARRGRARSRPARATRGGGAVAACASGDRGHRGAGSRGGRDRIVGAARNRTEPAHARRRLISCAASAGSSGNGIASPRRSAWRRLRVLSRVPTAVRARALRKKRGCCGSVVLPKS
jgi:hypothetical protein